MELIRSPNIIQKKALEWRRRGIDVGFVPTMGALHKGHISLISAAKEENDITVVSIFVNPAQFTNSLDLKRYPKNIRKDKQICEKLKVDFLFYPKVKDMYPKPYLTWVEVRSLQDYLCGKYRKGHFVGVATIVLKLFNLIMPTRAYFGEKDYQQAIIIKKLVEDLNIPVSIITLPTVREEDGLACSSRNIHLSGKEREAATNIPKALNIAKDLIEKKITDTKRIIEEMKKLFKEPLFSLEYISISNPKTLTPIQKIKSGEEVLVALAVWINKTRLIDNMLIKA